MATAKPSIFDDKNEVKPQSINWGKIEDNVVGTKIAQRDGVKTKYKDKNFLYSIKVEAGFFHDKDGNKVELKPGELWDIWGRNQIFDAQMNRMQIGQKFGLKLIDIKPSTKGNDAKIIKVFTTGETDVEWLENQNLGAE